MMGGIDGGTIIDLPPTPGGTNSLALAIRDDGMVVGECGNTLKAWALPPESNRTWADVDGDGQIDGADIGLLLSAFGATS